MALKKVVIAVDEKFFTDIFEKQRIKLQKELGVINLSQANFTKMIRGLQMKPLKINISKFKLKIGGRKRNEIFRI